MIKTLREFQHIDDEERDQGANVRQKAKDITNMILDKQRLFRERASRAKMHGRSSGETDDGAPALPPRPRRRELRDGAQRAAEDEEDELRRAIEESRRSAAMERATAEDLDLARAIKMSEEEAERQKKLAAQSSAPLFDQGQQQYVYFGEHTRRIALTPAKGSCSCGAGAAAHRRDAAPSGRCAHAASVYVDPASVHVLPTSVCSPPAPVHLRPAPVYLRSTSVHVVQSICAARGHAGKPLLSFPPNFS